MKIRMMLPMCIICNTCGNYLREGTKFNSRKEDAIGENYLGVQIFRFYFKCTKCSSEITYKTDPRNSYYIVEFGATRVSEPWREQEEEMEKLKRKRDDEEMGDAIKKLENKAADSKREMDVLAALDEMKCMRSRQAAVSVEMEEEDDALVKSLFKGKRENFIKRICDEELEEDDDLDIDNVAEKGDLSNEKFFSKPSLAKLVVVKKASGNKRVVKEEKQDIEDKIDVIFNLCQYESGDDY